MIVDRTGLSQFFDVDLKWTSDSPSGDAVGGINLPGLFTALKEQLGLRLEDARGPVEVVVVDSVASLIRVCRSSGADVFCQPFVGCGGC